MKNADVDQQEMETAISFMRKALSTIADNKDRIPHVIYMPDGSIVDLLDEKTESFLNELECLFITKGRP